MTVTVWSVTFIIAVMEDFRDLREGLDASKLSGNDERGGSSRGIGLRVGESELLGVVGDDHADEEDAEAVEEENSVEGELDGLGDRTTRVLGLASSNTNEFGSEVSESSVDHDGPETEESLHIRGGRGVTLTHRRPLSKSTRVVPVPEPTGIAIGTTATGNDETEKNDAEDNDDLERGEPELELAEELDAAKVVDADDGDEEDCDKDTGVDLIAVDPELDGQSSGGELVWRDDDVLEPITIPRAC